MTAPQTNNDSDLRGLMFSIAYRMTGSVAEAEDLVQEAFFRLERARRDGVVVESPKAYAAAATTRLAIDHMRSARVRREAYVGTWLPEPIVTDLHPSPESPEQMAELSDSLSMAFLAAARGGDLDQLVDLLAADAVMCGDGGGKASAVRQALHGRDVIAGFIISLFKRAVPLGATAEPVRVNGGPGIMLRDAQHKVVSVLSLEVADGVIQTLRGVVNPDKLQHLGPVSDLARIPRPQQGTSA